MPEIDRPPVHHVVAKANPNDDQTRVLRDGDAFAVLDHHGEIDTGGLGEEGLFFDGTRFLSRLRLFLSDAPPFFLAVTNEAVESELYATWTNPDWLEGDRVDVPLGTLLVTARKTLVDTTLHHLVRIGNHSRKPIRISVKLEFASDYKDIFEVRGMKRARRGEELPAAIKGNNVTLGYRGLDSVARRTRISFDPAPTVLSATEARFDVTLAPRSEWTLDSKFTCEIDGASRIAPRYLDALAQSRAKLEHARGPTRIETSNVIVSKWIDRGCSDVALMTTELPTGPYPYAGIPWFNTPFGRDGIITALEMMVLKPSLAHGVLAFLASTQSHESVAAEDSEPGKVLHETRNGEMARLKEMPFGRYYGNVDGTPLFIVLAGAYFERTGDIDSMRALWPSIEAALEWIEAHGDHDGDGFVEYQRRARDGLVHQGWKDSDDSVMHADGTPARGAIALAEVQSYVYGAHRAASRIARALGIDEVATQQARRAELLREKFDQAFWSDAIGCYALALDGDKKPCLVRSSNAGHTLFTGLAKRERAETLVKTLMSEPMWSGWGVRTLGAGEACFQPMGYHNGSIWPHDNALIAQGFATYGFADEATAIAHAQLDASQHFELMRMPELFCGFVREPDSGPVLYPVACSPQAWAAASVASLVSSTLGLEVDARRNQVTLRKPMLLRGVDKLRIVGLEVGSGTVDMTLTRQAAGVSVHVDRRTGDVRVVVAY